MKYWFIRYIIYIILIGTIITAIEKNPNREKYNLWIANQVTNNTENLLIQSVVNMLSEPILNSSTTQTNYLLFSVYETDLTSVGMEKIIVIGTFGEFIPIK